MLILLINIVYYTLYWYTDDMTTCYNDWMYNVLNEEKSIDVNNYEIHYVDKCFDVMLYNLFISWTCGSIENDVIINLLKNRIFY